MPAAGQPPVDRRCAPADGHALGAQTGRRQRALDHGLHVPVDTLRHGVPGARRLLRRVGECREMVGVGGGGGKVRVWCLVLGD